jgi:GT2 family glycosyltransferase
MKLKARDYGLIVVHYRDPDGVASLLRAVSAWSVHPAATVVIDNSQDLPDMDVKIVRRPNVGYGPAVNAGFDYLRSLGLRYGLICTQDALLEDDCAELMLDEIWDSPDVAVAGPKLLFRSDPDIVFSVGGLLGSDGRCAHESHGDPRELSTQALEQSKDVDWLDGAVMLVDLKASLNEGDFDPFYFLYVEEIDFQLSLRKAGFRVVSVGNAIAYQEPGNFPTYLRYRNHRYLTRKHCDVLEDWPWGRVLLRDLAKMLAKRQRFEPRDAIRGVLDASRLRGGKNGV